MDIGCHLPNQGPLATREALATFARAADERGVASLWVSDHVIFPRTATGSTPRWGTVAVDPRVIPLGSRLLIEGFDGMVFVTEDTGGAVRGNVIDVWFDEPAAAARFGTQSRTVTVLTQER